MDIIKPDWNKFRAKFSENPQDNFEWFCNLLFCKEFNQSFGIFRYKNQSGIETDPIIKDEEIIGWQAKFYETTLSSHKNDIIETIGRVKRDYPNITKIIFYSNQEWAQRTDQEDKSKKPPKGLIEIEEKAENLQIKIDWRTASFFESHFVTIDNKITAQHFFSQDQSIIGLVNEKKVHNEVVFHEIHTNINFNDQKIEIDRSEILQNIENELRQKQILIISGVGGVGKTAVIKNLYKKIGDKNPFYVFKANEFNINNINDLFNGLNFRDFIDFQDNEKIKIIVIDSAEKLLELPNTDIFKEFLLNLIENNWKIIFTTRNNYLENLNYEFIDRYNINPFNLDIKNLDESDLENLSSKYSFSLPEDSKLSDLIKNPFYLNEYLRFYNEKETLDYSNFKEKLWNNIIKRSKPSREQCFLKTAFERANQSQFFVNPDCDSQILDNFVQDGILGYETAGYFITHDIYEEWALEKRIDSEFIKKQDNKEFFEKIGESLPIRRSFRNWVSENLLLRNDFIKIFIEEIIQDKEIKSFWKDEVLVSVLLSDYSESFFKQFHEELIEADQKFITKLVFLLRIACKEVDNDFFQALGIKEVDSLPITYFFTKPKGKGWQSLIKFVYQNLESIKIENVTFIFSLIHDWNSKFKKGETTRFSGLIALKYYEWAIEEDKYLDKIIEEKILQTILYGASEIKDELIIIFDKILENRWNSPRDPYNELINAILTKMGVNIEVIKVLPEYVLRLADLFWFKNHPKKDDFHNSGHQGDLPFMDDPLDLDGKFCLKRYIKDYFPSSSFQTPIYGLLHYSFEKTINFIIDFTNKTIECYAKSDLGKGELFDSEEEIFSFGKEKVKEIDVFIDGKITKQYIDETIWNVYRGTKKSPYLLQSIHMALEKFFLERAEKFDPEILESWLLYLLKNTKSASITAVIVSIVLAFPDRTFNVAKALFQTKEFFIYDTSRLSLENTSESLYGIGFGVNSQRDFYQRERIKTCEDEHRKMSLEGLALYYQVFRNEQISEKEVNKRQQVIWNIFDEYYKNLPDETEESEFDKTWRLYLARMDSRMMAPKIEAKEDHILVKFVTKLGSKLKKYSETSTNEISEKMKYMPLKMWSTYKIKNDDQYKQFKQYNDPKLVFKEIKKVIEGFKSKDREFFLFYRSIPGDACSVLLRDYFEELSKDQKIFCKDIILELSSLSLTNNYAYQFGDGVASSISVLPILLREFPEEKESIKSTLLLTLFDPNPMGVGREFCDYSKEAILHYLWDISFEDAESLLFGYLWLKPKYEKLRSELREKNYKKNIYELHEIQLIKEFASENETELKKVIDNKITISDLNEIEKLDLYVLKTAFQLIPSKTNNMEHKKLAEIIISTIAKDLLLNKRENEVDYWVRLDFLEKLADFVLNSPEEDIYHYLKPFIDNFSNAESMADFFKEFAYTEDRLNVYDNFWKVWNLFYEKIVELCKSGDNYHTKKVIKGYLFAENIWKKEATQWHTFKEADKRFFKKLTDNIGCCPSVLYSISKLLNGIGSIYLEDGISWISRMLKVNKNLWSNDLEANTIYYLENIVRKYAYTNREKIRKTKQLKQEFLVILDFLIQKESVVGYMLRENIL